MQSQHTQETYKACPAARPSSLCTWVHALLRAGALVHSGENGLIRGGLASKPAPRERKGVRSPSLRPAGQKKKTARSGTSSALEPLRPSHATYHPTCAPTPRSGPAGARACSGIHSFIHQSTHPSIHSLACSSAAHMAILAPQSKSRKLEILPWDCSVRLVQLVAKSCQERMFLS